MSIFKGAGVAIVTPMKENEEVNYEKLQELIEWQIDQGTDAIIIAGTTGESSTLTMEEHSKVIKAAVEFAKHRVPVVAGSGSNCTREAIYLTQEAEEAGADGILAVTPYYNKCTQGGLVRYYSEIAECTKLPIIMYNVPGRTGCNILPETAAKIFKEVENVVAIKEATGSVAQASQLMYLTDGRIDLYSGEDGIVVSAYGDRCDRSDLCMVKCCTCQSTWHVPEFLQRRLTDRNEDTERGTAACQCIILRGQPDSGEESFKPHGKRSWNTSFSFDGDDRCKCSRFGRCDEGIWHSGLI